MPLFFSRMIERWCRIRPRIQRAAHRPFRPRLEWLEGRDLLAGPDAFEPDNTAETARTIGTNGSAQSHSLHAEGGDVDWVRFHLVASSDITARAQVLGGDGLGWVELALFADADPANPIRADIPQEGGLLRAYGLPAGDYLVRASNGFQDVDSYSLSVRSEPTRPPLERPSFALMAGEGFHSIHFDPFGRLAQLVWYDEELVYRVRESGGGFTDEVVFASDYRSIDHRTPRDPDQAQMAFDRMGNPHVFVASNGEVLHYARQEHSWDVLETVPLGTSNDEFVTHLAVVTGADGVFHVAAIVSPFFGQGRLLYATNRGNTWAVQQAVASVASETNFYFTATPYRYFSLAVDSHNAAHLTYTPEFKDNGQGGFSRPFSQLAYATNRNGAWETRVVHQPSDDSGDSGGGASVAIGPQDQVVIGQFFVDRVSTGSASFSQLLFHERRGDGSWATEVVTSSPDSYSAGDGPRFTGFAPHVMFDGLGQVHIAFSDHASQHFPATGADEFAGQIRHAVKSGGRWNFQTVLRQTDPLRNHLFYPTMAIFSNEIAFAGIVDIDVLDGSLNVSSSDYYYAQTSIPQKGLTLTMASPSLLEGDRATVTVTRYLGDNRDPLDVALSVTDSTEAAVPVSVRIPAGMASSSFTLSLLHDGQTDGAQPVTIQASSAGYAPARTLVIVGDATASVTGTVFHDLNVDEQINVGEPGLSGWNVFVDQNQDGLRQSNEPQATTDHQGIYTIPDVAFGSHLVRVESPGDWMLHAPVAGGYRVELTTGNPIAAAHFSAITTNFYPVPGLLAVRLQNASRVELEVQSAPVRQFRVLVDGTPDVEIGWRATADVRSIRVESGEGGNPIDLRAIAAGVFDNLAYVLIRNPEGADEIHGTSLSDSIAHVLKPGQGATLLTERLDAGEGIDSWLLDEAGSAFDLSSVEIDQIKNLESLDLRGGHDNRIKLSVDSSARLASGGVPLLVQLGAEDNLELVGTWHLDTPMMVHGRRVHVAASGSSSLYLDAGSFWRNPVHATDVTGDWQLAPIDALVVINELNRRLGSGESLLLLAAESSPWPLPAFYDVNADGVLAPIDALVVINEINGDA